MDLGRVVGIVCVLAAAGRPLAAQISPGRLARPHQELEGTLRCMACHDVARNAEMNTLCVACHKEIAWLVGRDRGLHARVKAQRCASCHPDHAGASFAMIAWPDGGSPERFDHTRAGWPLTGKHEKLKCADCHKPALRVSEAARQSPRRGPDPGWLGLEQGCVTCHRDPHRNRLGPKCTECHVTTSWKDIGRSAFNHDRTRYPLRGKHAGVRCEKCHDFSGGKLVNTTVRFATCTDCHRDAHATTATLAGRTVDCASCHVVNGWTPSTYTVAQHRQAAYRLEGRHERVACDACHIKRPPGVMAATLGTAAVWMRPVATRCQSCHADDHNGQLARRAGAGACDGCHTVAGWTPSTYTIATHATLRLGLTGRHAEIRCAACHGPTRPGLPALASAQVLGKARVAVTLTEVACASCHLDPHRGKVPRCLDCHDTRTFRPSSVDVAAHDRYRLKLEGAHRAVPCVACHVDMKHPATTSSLVATRWTFAPLSFASPANGCAGCHATPHGTQFAERGACDRCHGVASFRPADRFDHERDARFSLKGAHASVACARCHLTRRSAPGKTVVMYRPISGKCETCHSEDTRRGS